MRWVKLAGAAVAALSALVIAAGLAIYLGGDRAAAWVLEHPGSALLGRRIAIGGPLTIAWGDPTRIVIHDLRVANASWGSQAQMLSVKTLAIEISPASLIAGPIQIPRLVLQGARLVLETSAEGEGNWKFSTGTPKQRSEFPELQHFEVSDSTLIYRNGRTKAETTISVRTLALDAPDAKGPVKIAGNGAFQALPIGLSGTVGPLQTLRGSNQPYPVAFDVGLAALDLSFQGGIAHPLDFSGVDLRFSFGGQGFEKLGDALGLPLPAVPDVRGTSVLAGGNGSWQLNSISLKVGHSDLEGGIDIDTSQEVPKLAANFTSGFIDLADFRGIYGGNPKTSPAQEHAAQGGRVMPNTPIAVHKLPDVNATLEFYGTRIKAAGDLPIEGITLGIAIQNGQLVIDPLRFHVALGDLALKATYDPFTRTSPPRLHADGDISHIDLHRLFGAPTMPEIVRRTAGTVGGFIKFDATGVSLRQFLSDMNGDAALFIANGQLSDLLQKLAPIDVLGALGVYARGDRSVPVDCFVARFGIRNGVATASTLLAKTPGTTIVGSGNVNFGSETLYLDFKPHNNDFTPLTLHTPIDVRGTLRKPEFHLESGGLIARLGAAAGLGVLFPPAALLPLIDAGLGPSNACTAAYARQVTPGVSTPQAGSSEPPRR